MRHRQGHEASGMRQEGGHGDAGKPAPSRRRVGLALFGGAALTACAPTVRVEAPDEPIEINLNVRIEQEVRIRIDRELEEAFEDNDDIF